MPMARLRVWGLEVVLLLASPFVIASLSSKLGFWGLLYGF